MTLFRLARRLLLIPALLLAVPLLAQENDNSSEQEDAETERQEEASTPTVPPLDYEASEQIREDVPVSFPVDI